MEMEMEEEREWKATDADTVAEEEEEEDVLRRMRIYVGGLSEKVTEEDLKKTFSSLGRVEGVDFVRTSGRNFAYIDFHPATEKSLSKLFSSYNGCVWKGGKLRLEKAKEHYLSRLRREWDEDTKLAEKTNKEPVADESKDPPQKSKLVTLEKKQLQIFFPKLRKVKSVPYSGTGKHKYSFQRIEVPSLPIHFCDCEEHCAPDIAKVKQKSDLEDQAGSVNEEELNMMTSVMNRLFKRGVNSNTECSKVMGTMEGSSSKHSMEDVPFKGSVDQDNHLKYSVPSNEIDVDQDDDADNLVINMVGGGNTRSGSMETGRLENVNQESKFGKRHLSTVGSTENKIKAWEYSDPFNSSDTISKKARLLPSDGSTRNELKFTMPKEKGHPDNCSKSPTAPLVTHSDQARNIQQLNTSLSRRQKSSWRNLVGETANSSFSISQILADPSTSQNSRKSDILPDPIINQSLPTSICFDTANTTDRKRQKLRKQVRPKSTNPDPEELGNVEHLQGKVSTDATPVDQDEILQDKVCTGGHFDDTQKLRKLVTCDSAHVEPARLEKGEILQEKVSTDSPTIEAQKLLKQGISDSTGSEPAELVKDAILQNKDSLDGPSVNTETGISFKEPDNPEKVKPTDQKVTNHQTGRSWIQKSSWTELVGKMDNSSFSISNILPDIAAKRLNLPNDDSTDTINPFDNKQQHSAKQLTNKVIGSSSSAFRKPGISHDEKTPIGTNIISSAKEKDTMVGLEGVIDGVEKSSEKGKMGDKLSGGKTFSASNKRTSFDAGIGEVCTFMRSKESEKEWLKAKAALSAALKKKSCEK